MAWWIAYVAVGLEIFICRSISSELWTDMYLLAFTHENVPSFMIIIQCNSIPVGTNNIQMDTKPHMSHWEGQNVNGNDEFGPVTLKIWVKFDLLVTSKDTYITIDMLFPCIHVTKPYVRQHVYMCNLRYAYISPTSTSLLPGMCGLVCRMTQSFHTAAHFHVCCTSSETISTSRDRWQVKDLSWWSLTRHEDGLQHERAVSSCHDFGLLIPKSCKTRLEWLVSVVCEHGFCHVYAWKVTWKQIYAATSESGNKRKVFRCEEAKSKKAMLGKKQHSFHIRPHNEEIKPQKKGA